MDYVKGESLSDAVRARWRALRREDRLKILTHVDATDHGPALRKDLSAVVSGLIHMKDSLVFKNATGLPFRCRRSRRKPSSRRTVPRSNAMTPNEAYTS